MYKYLEQFEELLDDVISDMDSKGFEEFKNRVVERLNEID